MSEERFVRFVAAKLPVGTVVAQALGQLCADDLYLACACAGGDARAIAHLEAHCRSTIDRAAARLGASAEQIDEVRQRTRARLLAPRAAAGEGRAEPRIAAFSGRGSLRAWVRVTATHETLRLLRPGRLELGEEDDDLARELEREPVAGPELAYFKQLYRDEFKAAFAEAVEALSERDRTVLRQYALDGLSIDSLASLHRVHRATAARWVEAARQAAFDHTRRALKRRLRLRPDELESVLRVLHSQLDITIAPLLREAAPGRGPRAR